MQNLIPFPSPKRNRPDASTLDIPATPEELEFLLTNKRELLISATNYLEALCTSLKHDIEAVADHAMNTDGRAVQKA
ncbi:hypothetical protein [Rhizobium leucaenae]|uniref:AAA+ superfamily predicted ATPase n=1 Tax=Rhizobium leucaenae TaxID=29450 RepID=A0A7W6ZW84_9HYPH|nr:hypothetical protein [Rhizobium leucaenae]MBB4569367.1 AAA+ superfamily predicted ATPase [Rhizobium leucaenae]MBB6302819.1 AAA+ superfamily predicted ATPase [Rhizobium leucaenae]